MLSPSSAETSSSTSQPSLSSSPTPAPLVVYDAAPQFRYVTIPPAGVTSITVHLWGAGGGGGFGTDALGGAGAYVTGTLAVAAGETLRVIVGRGGDWTDSTTDLRLHQPEYYGGGGYGAPPPSRITAAKYYGGGGGGRSALQRLVNAATGQWVDVVTAGGGGGGGGFNTAGGTAGVVRGRRGCDQAQSTSWARNALAWVNTSSTCGGGGAQTAGGSGNYKCRWLAGQRR